MTGSAASYFCLFILIVIKIFSNIRHNSKYLFLSFPIILVIILSDELRVRFLEIFSVIFSTNTIKIADLGSSSLTFFNNLFVASKSFLDNPLFGSGIGNHSIAYDKYIELSNLPDAGLNKGDANSLYLRILSELGLFGILTSILFFLKFNLFKKNVTIYSTSSQIIKDINSATFFGAILYMVRFGLYYDVIFLFNCVMVFLTFKQYKNLENGKYP
jgi:hypothetical protein